MRIALIQQHAGTDRRENVERGLAALRSAAGAGAELICYAELAFDRFHPQQRPDGPSRLRAHRGPSGWPGGRALHGILAPGCLRRGIRHAP